MPGQNEEPSAPYIPFRTFLNLIIKMEDGVPQRLDKSFLIAQAGGLHQPIIAAFRFFGFVDDEGLTQPSLHEVATGGDRRDEFLAVAFDHAYLWANELGNNATQQQLDEAFKLNTGFGGSTLRKAVTFYLHAARHLGYPLSKHFSAPRAAGGGASPGKPRKKAAPKRATSTGKDAASASPPPSRSNLHPVAAALVDALIKQLEAGAGKFDEEAFDKWVFAFKGTAPVWSGQP